MNENTIDIQIRVDKKTGQTQLKQFGEETERTFGKMGKSAKRTTSYFSSFTKSIFSLKTAIVAAAGSAGLGLLARSFTQAASTAEQYRVRLNVMLGSQKEGSRLFQEMADYAGRVPFEYEKIMGAATSLSGVMKGGVNEIKQWMPLIGDLAAATGMSIEETTSQVIRMYSAGAQSADMFRERGVLSMLGFQAGVSYSAEETRKKMFEAWNKADSQFKGATEGLAGTWSGLMSMFSDAWFSFRNMVMDSGVFELMKTGFGSIYDKIKELRESGDLRAFAQNIGTFILGSIKSAITTTKLFHQAWTFAWMNIKTTFGMEWFQEHIIKPLQTSYNWLKDKVIVAWEYWTDTAREAAGIIEETTPEETKKRVAEIAEQYEKWENKIQAIIDGLGKEEEAEDKNSKAKRKNTQEIIKNTKELEKAIATREKATQALINEIYALEESGIALGKIDWMAAIAERQGPSTYLEQLRGYYKEQAELSEEAQKERLDALEEEEKRQKETYDSIAGFYREALMQMGADTSDFISMVLSKLTNMAATIAAETLTAATMSVLGKIGGKAAGGGAEETTEKAAGGIASLAGGKLGWAITGGMIGYSVIKSIIDKSDEAERRRKMRAEEYKRQLEIAATSQATTWDEWFEGADKLISPKAAYAMAEYGGVSDIGLKENLLRVAEIGREYKKAVEEHGDASLQAIESYHALGMQMEMFSAQSKAWSKEGQKLAEQWEAVWEKTREIQINEILDDIDKGVGTFLTTLSKLELLDLDEAELATIQYNETLKFLTDDTLPALQGELAKARQIFKESAIEVEKLARAEEEAAIKAKILASDLELTEGQLKALRTGEVNLEMLELYEALGWVDKELELISVSAEEAATGFEKMEESAQLATDTLEDMAQQFSQFEKVNEDLQELYDNLVKVAVGIELIAKAGQQLEELPDTFELAVEALKEGDLQEVQIQLQKILSTFYYVSQVLETIGAEQLAEISRGIGEIAAGTYLLISLWLGFENTITTVLERNEELAIKLDKYLTEIEERHPWFVEWMRGRFPVEPEPIIAAPEDIGIEGGKKEDRYQAAMDYIAPAIEILETTGMSEYEKGLYAINKQFDQYLDYLLNANLTVAEYIELTGKVEDARAQALENLEKKYEEIEKAEAAAAERAREAFLKPLQDIIATAGMTDLEKSIYNLNQWYQDQKEIARELGVSLGELNAAYSIQAENIINQFWNPVIDDIKASILDLEASAFNLGTPQARAAGAASRYAGLKAALQGATGQDFVTALEAFKGYYPTYLTEMQKAYKSGTGYLSAYEDVMKTLQEAENQATQEQNLMLSEFEQGMFKSQQDIIIKLQSIKEQDVVNLNEYKEHTEALINLQNNILTETKNYSRDMYNELSAQTEKMDTQIELLRGLTRNGSSSTIKNAGNQSEPITGPPKGYEWVGFERMG